LGDSGFVVIRQNKIVHRSQEQTHYFNSPFQMAILPNVRASFLVEQNYDEIIQEQNNNNNNNNQNIDTSSLINDSPDMASVSSFDLREGDFIVIATDGLWDNLNENALLIEISKIKVSFILVKIF
jgi:protein phosphatase PTC7